MGAVKDAIIFAGGDFSTEDINICERLCNFDNSYIICADKGYEYCRSLNISPNIVIGDFDSTIKPSGDFAVESYLPQKDDTDTMLCIKKAFELNFDRIIILGALGGRFDHSIANIQALSYIAENGAMGYIVDSHHIITVISDGACVEIKKYEGYLSIFALSDKVTGLNIEGCEYNLDSAELTNKFPLGVSNRVVSDMAKVSVDSGYLLVIQNFQ